jgi:hypothetical protein
VVTLIDDKTWEAQIARLAERVPEAADNAA